MHEFLHIYSALAGLDMHLCSILIRELSGCIHLRI